MKQETELEPVCKLDELQMLLKGNDFEIHRAGDSSPEYSYLKEGCMCIAVQNPFQDTVMFIDLSEEFTLTYGAFHSHYAPYSEDYKEMLLGIQEILENKICSAALYYHYSGERKWLGSLCIAKEELSRPIGEIFSFVLHQAENKRNLAQYGGEAQFRFWNPADDRVVEIPKIVT